MGWDVESRNPVRVEKINLVDSEGNPLGSHQGEAFDRLLMHEWNVRVEEGLFRYKISDDLGRHRRLAGDVGFIAQLVEERATQKRKAQEVTDQCICQPFNPNAFNFARVKNTRELIGYVKRAADGDHQDKGGEHALFINVSPFEMGSCLLVPSIDEKLPQVLTADALLLGVLFCASSDRSGLRVGYNSLRAFASVNHLHLQSYYLDYQLPCETAAREAISKGEVTGTGVSAFLVRSHVPGFVFVLDESHDSFTQLVSAAFSFVSHLIRSDIAHNLLVSGNGRSVFVFPRVKELGVKSDFAFNPAFIELAGHLILKTRDLFDTLDEEGAKRLFSGVSLREEQLSALQSTAAASAANAGDGASAALDGGDTSSLVIPPS